MIATLPMYDRPETASANDRLWDLIRDQLPGAPTRLTRDGDTHWTDPDLMLSQTCSLPFRTALRDKVTLVAAPVNDLDGPPGSYFSVLIARKDDPRSSLPEFHAARLAINARDSQSGWAAIEAEARKLSVEFQSIAVTGAHLESARAVAEGRADLAAIDAVSWSMIRRWDGFAAELSVFGETPPSPALPYITAAGNDPGPLRVALSRAIEALGRQDRKTLCLTGISDAKPETYFAMGCANR